MAQRKLSLELDCGCSGQIECPGCGFTGCLCDFDDAGLNGTFDDDPEHVHCLLDQGNCTPDRVICNECFTVMPFSEWYEQYRKGE